MNILLLGEKSNLIYDKIISLGHNAYIICDKITIDIAEQYDFIISFGYRHIIKEDIIDKFINKIINLHISYLPYNKGADPNLWSYLENTPKGVTIHYIDKGLDTGDILVQKLVQDNIETDTLKTSFDRLINEIVVLFNENIDDILKGNIKSKKQQGNGSLHYLKDKEKFIGLIAEKGYNTLVKDLILGGGIFNGCIDNINLVHKNKEYNNIRLIKFINCNIGLLNEILQWRNHISVRLSSKNNNIIEIDEHYKFIDSLKKDTSKLYFVVQIENLNIGVISFTHINKQSAYIGYYKNPFTTAKGIGSILIEIAKYYAYNTLLINEVYMEVLNKNSISKHCVLKAGFQKINEKNNIIIYKLRLK